jgi:RHS repeat-associated protein
MLRAAHSAVRGVLTTMLVLGACVSSASADSWSVEGGSHYLRGGSGSVIKSWTASEWRLWRKEVESVGECMGVVEGCARKLISGETPVEAVPRGTAEAAQSGVESARGGAGGSLTEGEKALDQSGIAAGTLPRDLGSGSIEHARLVPGTIGVELGNGLHQLYEVPEKRPFESKAEEEEVEEWRDGSSEFVGGSLREPYTVRACFELHDHGEPPPDGCEEWVPRRTYPPGTYFLQWPPAGGIVFGNREEEEWCESGSLEEGTCVGLKREVTLDTEGPVMPKGEGWERYEAFMGEGFTRTGVLSRGWLVFVTHNSPECGTAPSGYLCTADGLPAPGGLGSAEERDILWTGLTPPLIDSEPVSLPTAPPSSLSESELDKLSESEEGRKYLEGMFPNKGAEYAEAEGGEGGSFGSGSGGEPEHKHCFAGEPVNCATGNETSSQTDLAVGGRGPGLRLELTYNSQLAVKEATAGAFGFGWTGSYSAHLELKDEGEQATVYEGSGSSVVFAKEGEAWTASSSLVQSTLASEGSGYVYTLPDQTRLRFDSAGQLTSEEDRNGNAITLAYNAEHELESATDGAGRKLTFKYDVGGQVESASDPMGHTVKYTYESGNLASVTLPGEAKARWKYKYNGEHELTSVTDGRENTSTIEYDEAHQVKAQTDPLGRKRSWEYAQTEHGSETTITEPNGAKTVEHFNEYGSPTSVTRAAGTSMASTSRYEYSGADLLLAYVDPDGQKTEYAYDAAGNKVSEKNADGDEAKWKYDGAHDIETETTPEGETTTIKRNSHGDPETIERPIGGETQKTTYKYDSYGDLESMTNPLGQTWKYEYDSYGDRKAETDPEGNKRTWEYNEDSQEIASVSPRGNVAGGKPESFTTKTERDAQGRAIKITDPLKHATKYTYDADGNLETLTDPDGNKTKYVYDADNELTKTEEPAGTSTETEYDSMGQVKSQTNGDKHTTKYERNLLGEITEVTDPKERKTTDEYDAAGNLTSETNAEKRTTTYKYDPANRLEEITYSDGKTHSVEYEYDEDGRLTEMRDGTGATKYTYDKLDRLTEAENGHKEVTKYQYNLVGEPTSITYPNGKEVTRAYDKDARLEKITDWNAKITRFTYDEDSNLKAIVYPSETKDEDAYAYNDADAMTEVKMKKSSETLTSLKYTRGDDGEVTATTSKGLPGEETLSYEYDKNSRLTKGAGVAYEYDAANDPTKIGAATYKYDAADELESGGGSTYTYNEVGQRTKTAPEKGPATTYSYDQAGNLTAVERPREGEATAIEDAYTYNGEGLRTSETIDGTASYLDWDQAEPGLPSILSNGTYSFIYGPDEMPIEQINNTNGQVLYLHHDQAGSTRLITGSTGKTEATFTYSPYGELTGHTGTATTPLGFDDQYTSTDTGLIYLRNRVYDPSTAQFLTVDPLVSRTLAPYSYAGDDPVNEQDRTGLEEETGYCIFPAGCVSIPGGNGGGSHGVEVVKEIAEKNWHEFEGGAERIGEAVGSIWNEVTGQGGTGQPVPPGHKPETWRKGPASRESEPGENWWDPEGGEWHWDPDPYGNHPEFPEGHWDYKPGAPWNARWKRLPPC